MASFFRIPSLTSNRLLVYGATSTALAASCILNVSATKTNFYAASVAIAKSNGAVMILANFALFVSLMLGIGLQRIFFGRLRAIEVEHLYDRSWYFLTESILALTMFREDFDAPFIIMFGLLLFLKCFHWIAADRVEWMDQLPPPGPPLSFHLRLVCLLCFLVTANMALLAVATTHVMEHGVSGKVLFLAESALLHVSWTNLVGKYTLSLYERWREARDRRAAAGGAEDEEDDRGWEGKSMAVFYVDLATDLIRLLTYLAYFLVILVHYGLPFNILRDVYLVTRSFISRIKTLVQYRAATANMDLRYPDATREEMEVMEDKVCIICREEMSWADRSEEGVEPPRPVPVVAADGTTTTPPRRRRRREEDRPKKLSCNHVFHLACLKSWLERQQNCPTCRRTVMTQPLGIGGAPQAANPNPPAAAPAHPHHPHPHRPQPTGHAGPPNGGAAPPQPGQVPAAPAAGRIWGAPIQPPAGFDRVPPLLPARLPALAPPPAAGRPANGFTFEISAFGHGVRVMLGQDAQAALPPALAPQLPLPVPVAPALPPALQPGVINPMFMRRPIPQPQAGPVPTPTPTRTVPAGEGAASEGKIVVRDVIQYMARVKSHYASDPAAYQTFLQLIQDHMSGALPPDLVLDKLVVLFGGVNDSSLIEGFSTILKPAGSSIQRNAVGIYEVVPPSADSESPSLLPLEAKPTSTPTQPSAETLSPSTDEPIDISTLTPREVAAQAALRRSARLNPGSSTPPPTSSRPITSTPTIPDLESTPVVQSTPALASPSPASALSPPTSPPTDATLPPEIFDLLHPSSSTPTPRQPTLTPLYAPSYYSSTPLPHPHPQPFAVATPPSPLSLHRPTLPISPTLAGDELRDADAWTRQAVEQRLMLLERVDGMLAGLRGDLKELLQEPGPVQPPGGKGKQAVEGPRVVVQSTRAATEPSEVPLPDEDDAGEL